MPNTNQSVGKLGEQIARQYLQKKSFDILEKNYRTRFGEIDIIVQKDNQIRFIEVKTRIGTIKGMPYEAVNFYKIKHMQRASQYYLLQKKLKNYKLSLDVISIVLNADMTVRQIDFYENISS